MAGAHDAGGADEDKVRNVVRVLERVRRRQVAALWGTDANHDPSPSENDTYAVTVSIIERLPLKLMLHLTNISWLGMRCVVLTMLCPTSTILSTPMRCRQDAREPRKNSSASARFRAVQCGRPAHAQSWHEHQRCALKDLSCRVTRYRPCRDGKGLA